MDARTRTVVGYALLFSIPVGVGLGVAVEVSGGGTSLAALSTVGVAIVLFVALVGVFAAGSPEREE